VPIMCITTGTAAFRKATMLAGKEIWNEKVAALNLN